MIDKGVEYNECGLTYSALTMTLDDIVEVGTGSLTVWLQVGQFHLSLLSEDVHLNEVIVARHATHGVLLGKRLSCLAAQGSHL